MPSSQRGNPGSAKPEPSLVLVAAIVTVAMAILPVLWVLIEAALHVPPTNLMELGAIAGAIFTAGGLIVALVSLYSMANVQKIARSEVNRLLETLHVQVNDRIQTYLRAYDRYLQAVEVVRRFGLAGVADAETHINAALEIDPALVGACSWMGGAYYELAGVQFLELYRDGGIHTPQYLPETALPTTVTRAINWLVQAKLNRESDVVETTARLAELYGMLGGYHHEMLSCIRQVIDAGRAEAFEGNCSRAFLAAGCGTDTGLLSQLASLLGCELPWSPQKLEDEWKAYCHEYNLRGPTFARLYLWAILRSAPRADDPRTPSGVHLLPASGGAQMRAQWIARIQVPGQQIRRGGIPEIEYHADGSISELEPLPTADVLRMLQDRFLVIGRAEWLQFPERT